MREPRDKPLSEDARLAFERAAAPVFARHPDSVNLFIDAAWAERGRLASIVLSIMGCGVRPDIEAPTILELFDRGARRAALDRPPLLDQVESGAGLEGCAEFDRRLERAVEGNALFAALELAVPGSTTDAIAGCRAARRLEELEEDPPEDEAARSQLTLDALKDFDRLVRAAPGVGLLLRARARLAALPAPLGPALARLDLARLDHFWREFVATQRNDGELRISADALFQGASVAARTPGGGPIEKRLLEIAIELAHEVAIGQAREDGGPDRLGDYLANINARLVMDMRCRGLPEGLRDALAPTAEDRRRVASKRFVYRDGRVAPSESFDDVRFLRVEVTSAEGGRTLHIEAEVENTGRTTWDETYRLNVGGHMPGPHAEYLDEGAFPPASFVADGERVAPGGRHVFSFDLPAPPGSGRWKITVGLDHYGVGHFGPVPARSFPPDAPGPH